MKWIKAALFAALSLIATPASANFEFGDLICETTTSTGTGTVNLGGAISNYLGFASQIDSGDTVPYTISASDGKLETGIGTFTDGAPDTLSRTADWSSDGSGAELTLPAGSHTVCVGPITSIYTGGGTATSWNPTTDDAATLGTTSLRWSDQFLAEGGTINWDAGDCVLTQTGNSLDLTSCGLGIDATTESNIEAALDTLANVTSIGGDVTAGGDFTSTDDLISGDDVLLSDAGVINWNAGDCTLTEGTNTLTVAGTCTLITEVLTPDGDNTRDLGSTGATWATAHINSIELANGTANTLTATGGVLSVEGVATVLTTRTLTGGVGIAAIGDLSTDRTVTFDATEVTPSVTWGAGSFTTMTFNAGATDPVFTFGSNSLAISSAIVSVDQELNPDADGGADLGTTALSWDDLFLDTGAVINWNAGDCLLTHSADTLTLTGCSAVGFGGGSQTPWASNIDAADFDLTELDLLEVEDIELGVDATDTTIVRSAAGEATLEGDAIKHAGKQMMWISASALRNNATSPASCGDTFDSGSNDLTAAVCAFDTGATEERADFQIGMPKAWNEGTFTFIPISTCTGCSASQTIQYELACVAISHDDPMNAAMGTAQTSSVTVTAASDQLTGAESSAITCAGSPAENDLVAFRISRDTSVDNAAGDALLLGLKLFWTDNASTLAE